MLALDTIFALIVMPDNYSSEDMNKSYLEIGRTLVYSIIWTSYFLYSKRVKETFTKTYKGSRANIQFPDQNNQDAYKP
jgi:hypothetical protein